MPLSDVDATFRTNGARNLLLRAATMLCDVRDAPSTSNGDKLLVVRVINSLTTHSDNLSLLLPSPPPDTKP